MLRRNDPITRRPQEHVAPFGWNHKKGTIVWKYKYFAFIIVFFFRTLHVHWKHFKIRKWYGSINITNIRSCAYEIWMFLFLLSHVWGVSFGFSISSRFALRLEMNLFFEIVYILLLESHTTIAHVPKWRIMFNFEKLRVLLAHASTIVVNILLSDPTQWTRVFNTRCAMRRKTKSRSLIFQRYWRSPRLPETRKLSNDEFAPA